MRLFILIFAMFTTSQALSSDVDKRDIERFLQDHVKVARSCNTQAIKSHMVKYLASNFQMQRIYANSQRTTTPKNAFINEYISIFSVPEQSPQIRAMCQTYNISLGKTNLTNESAVFTTVEQSQMGKNICKSTAIKSNSKILITQSICQQQK